MNLIWGVILVVISSLGWLGQVISLVNPALGEKLGLTELKAEVDPTFYADVRGEALWDAIILWTLPAAGVLLILNNPVWAYFGLIGGGMFLYFAGRGIVVRRQMQRRGIRIGPPESLKVIYTFLALWGLTAAVTVVMAVAAVPLA
jgi:hypothetical protein